MEKSLKKDEGLIDDTKNNEEKENEETKNKSKNSENKLKNNAISLENVNFDDPNQEINSPRSLKACLRLGIKTYELFKLTENQFRDKYPDLIRLKGELFQYRYEAEEKYRKSMIKLAKEEREKLIKEEEKKREEKLKKEEEEKSKNIIPKKVDTKWEKLLEKEKKKI